MSENPYRAAGTFSGPSYTERSADRELRHAVRQNQRYPYMLAPHQTGKSSLLYRLRSELDPNIFRCGLVDFSTFKHIEFNNYDDFLVRLFSDFSDTLCVPRINVLGQPKKDLLALVATVSQPRVVLLLDEINELFRSPFKDTFFSTIRNIFNDRADPNQKELKRVQFVLAGVTRVEELITDSSRAPFNVGKRIWLGDFTLEEVRSLCIHLDASCGSVCTPGLPERLYHHAGGSVYLTQLILEGLWDWLQECGLEKLPAESVLAQVDALADGIVSEAAHDGHFRSIKQFLSDDPNALDLWRLAIAGKTLDKQQWDILRATGLVAQDSKVLYSNRIYASVFGHAAEDKSFFKARVFVSHSSKDKPFVRKLTEALNGYNLNVWLDETVLKVADSIVARVSLGLKNADYLLAVISKASISSRWVQAELNATLMEELSGKGVVVLPVLIEDCELPTLLKDRVYADFRRDFQAGLKQLLAVFEQEGQSVADAMPEVTTKASTSSSEQLPTLTLADLRRRLSKRMDRAEVSALWFDILETEMDADMPGRQLSDCVISLLDKARRRNKLSFIIEAVSQDRPELVDRTAKDL
jgi:hypothetical protein